MADTPTMTRGDVLRGAAMLFGSLAAGSVLAGLAPSTAWALEMNQLSTAQGDTILRMAQVLYPHKSLPTAVYALLVKDLDTAAAKDPATAKQLKDGTAALDAAAGGSFASASPDKQLAAVKSLQGTPFFGTVRSTCITSLYDNEMAYAHFGYEGASWPKGGYIRRGFDDLTWLPKPPLAASPAPAS